MASNRVYVHFTLFNVRVTDMRHLWEPSMEYQGRPQQNPNYIVGGIIPKTRANWWEEPTLAPAWAAYSELLQKSGMNPQQIAEWPIKDGDIPSEPGKQPADWMRGHWLLRGNSQQPISVSAVDSRGAVSPLPAKIGVKPGDLMALGLSAAINQQNNRAIKHFCSTVLFMAPGEEIAIGNSVTAAELMRQAQAQGLQVAGFGTMPGFTQPGSFAPSGFAPTGGPAFPNAPVGSFPAAAASPSNGPGAPGFTQPGVFAPTGGPAFPNAPVGSFPAAAASPSNGGPAFPAGPQFPQS